MASRLTWNSSASNLMPRLGTGPARLIDDPFRRRDRLEVLRLSLLNRLLEPGDFTPELALVREERKSNADRFRYGRSRIEVGLWRLFRWGDAAD